MLSLLAAADYTAETVDATANGAATAAVAGFGIFMLFWVVVGLVGFVYWLLMLIDAIKTDDATYESVGGGSKVLWLVLIIFLGLIGAVLYHILVKAKKGKTAPTAPATPAS